MEFVVDVMGPFGVAMSDDAFETKMRLKTVEPCRLVGVIGKVSLENIAPPLLAEGLAYWRSLLNGRRFPVRSDITLLGLKSVMRNTILMRVIGECEDYEYRYVGDAHIVAHGNKIQGKRWSELDTGSGLFSRQRRQFYDEVVRSGQPVLVAGYVARHFFDVSKMPDISFVFAKTLCLPLGRDDEVDHLLTVTVYDNTCANVLLDEPSD